MSVINRVFLDIDTQFDFMDPRGKLYVPGAREIVGALERLFAFAAHHKIPVLSSADDHLPDDPEFAQFGPHCVRGTPGQRKLPITLLSNRVTIRPEDALPHGAARLMADYDQLIFYKPGLNVFENPHFASLVDEVQVAEFIVFGVATDYCVLLEAGELLDRGQQVTIVRDAIAAITPEGGDQAFQTLSALGAKWIAAAEIVGLVEA